ncbi:MAG: hypothetical protein Unbinned2990contig1001_34 [Prokaryotic dsDNA virus sp.]|nr:MAG: hypothetical protein Unbinned2990contig1001_34 [Prokaryotic dsDNA virus sp.]|tara:strand:+ start:14874 stop:15065 length:192 start_codon:yes stop_codon:yes gene_type:complete
MKYKAGKDFAKLENKHFGPHKTKALLEGGVIDITVPENIPSDVLKTLEEVKDKVKKEVKKGDK